MSVKKERFVLVFECGMIDIDPGEFELQTNAIDEFGAPWEQSDSDRVLELDLHLCFTAESASVDPNNWIEEYISEGGFHETFKKQNLVKLYDLFQQQLKVWKEKYIFNKADSIPKRMLLPTLWEITFRSWKGHEDLYPDVEIDFEFLGSLSQFVADGN